MISRDLRTTQTWKWWHGAIETSFDITITDFHSQLFFLTQFNKTELYNRAIDAHRVNSRGLFRAINNVLHASVLLRYSCMWTLSLWMHVFGINVKRAEGRNEGIGSAQEVQEGYKIFSVKKICIFWLKITTEIDRTTCTSWEGSVGKAEWLEVLTCNPEVPGSSLLSDH